jgi:hypothetical protein
MSGISKRISNEYGTAHIENVKALLARADTRAKLDNLDAYKANFDAINWSKPSKKKRSYAKKNK